MKAFYDYNQQIEKLKNSDGLLIDDEESAKNYLRLEGYYNVINGYAHIFKIQRKFVEGVKFENIQNLYEFDKSIRSIVYKYTSTIECHIKALIAHEFSKNHGVDENEYLKSTSFTAKENSKEQVNRLIEDCKKTIDDALNKKSNKYREYIAHNKEVHGHVPMWVLIRALSFGTVSIFFKNMQDAEKDAIAQNYYISAEKLANILEVIVSFRNIVAHGERTFCARMPRTRLSTKLRIAEKLCIPKNPKGENKFGRSDFLALLIGCKYLLPPIEFSGFISELEICFDELAKNQTPTMVRKIKLEMGLWCERWSLLPCIKIDDNRIIA
ncbi:MAG: Abi family protein [Clostridiales bacterium]|nr:Abi family protein [Clostridiales bacterium]